MKKMQSVSAFPCISKLVNVNNTPGNLIQWDSELESHQRLRAESLCCLTMNLHTIGRCCSNVRRMMQNQSLRCLKVSKTGAWRIQAHWKWKHNRVCVLCIRAKWRIKSQRSQIYLSVVSDIKFVSVTIPAESWMTSTNTYTRLIS